MSEQTVIWKEIADRLNRELAAERATSGRYREALKRIERSGFSYHCKWCEANWICRPDCPAMIARLAQGRKEYEDPSRAVGSPSGVPALDPGTAQTGVCDNCGHEGPFAYVAGPPINGGLCATCTAIQRRTP